MANPAITVAMSVYNGERFLLPAIESVLAQTFTDFEFLILDDGSRDGTRATVEAMAARDSRIRPIVRENRGLVASLNQMIDEAQAPLIARMDADDICMPERLAKQVAFMAEHPDYGVVGSWCDEIDANDEPWPVTNTGPHHPANHEDFLIAIDKGWPLLCHPAVMFRRDLVLSVGGYHGAFRHCEDLDLWLRLASITRLASIPEPLIRYRHYDEQVSSRHATEQQIGAAIAKLAYYERLAGRPDPTENLERLPGTENLDALFGREGVGREVRAQVAPGLLYSKAGLRDHGFELLLRYLSEGGSHSGMWRTVVRLVRFGEPARAARLALRLASSLTPSAQAAGPA
ncbi:glycosyltransferase [Novosphingobium sp. PS1R-30]|uniref:Glycosyltransferase n=1 Tax=Novosphingobium anseongense TaxID=3133436 RepID=A0ABU8S2J7_9SPHN